MEGFDILNDAVDKKLIPPLQQKRFLAFVNHFLISSSMFLNEFITKCEEKFIDIERKMQKLESCLLIVEAKLSSIPDAKVDAADICDEKSNCPQPADNVTTNAPVSTTHCEKIDATANITVELSPGVEACEDDRYKKFFKMVQFGVPQNAVKMKMLAEGIDPSILDSPNAIVSDKQSS